MDGYPLVVYDEQGNWKRVTTKEDEDLLRPIFKRFQEWKIPETVVAAETVQIQNDVVITQETPINPIIPPINPVTPTRRPGRPSKRY